MVVDTVDKEDPAAPPGNEPNAAANVKSAGEAGRIDGFASVNGYDGVWHPADKSDGADDGGDSSGGDAGSDPAARPAAEAAEARPTDTEPLASTDTEPAKH